MELLKCYIVEKFIKIFLGYNIGLIFKGKSVKDNRVRNFEMIFYC